MISKYTNLMLSILLCFCVISNLNAMQAIRDNKAKGDTPIHVRQLFSLILQSSQTAGDGYKVSEVYQQMESFYDRVKSKKFAKKQSLSSLRKLYRFTSKQFIHNYQSYTFLPQMVGEKKYDCVSSALLYSFLLEELGFNYSIYLTKTHTYLTVHIDEKDVILETTDPTYGLITNPKEIKKQIEAYKAESISKALPYNELADTACKQISLQELVGVHFYNLFLYHYQNRDFDSAAKAFKKAAYLYKESPEIKMFSKYFAKS